MIFEEWNDSLLAERTRSWTILWLSMRSIAEPCHFGSLSRVGPWFGVVFYDNFYARILCRPPAVKSFIQFIFISVQCKPAQHTPFIPVTR